MISSQLRKCQTTTAHSIYRLMCLVEHIEHTLHQGRDASELIEFFNARVTGCYRDEDFLTYYLHTDLQGFVSTALSDPAVEAPGWY